MTTQYEIPDADAPKYLTDFKGTPAEQRTAKSTFITRYGFAAYEAIVLRSGKNVNR
jgi:hypothetical protein